MYIFLGQYFGLKSSFVTNFDRKKSKTPERTFRSKKKKKIDEREKRNIF